MKKHCDCFLVERVFKKERNILNLYFLISIIGISKKTLIRLSKVTNYLDYSKTKENVALLPQQKSSRLLAE